MYELTLDEMEQVSGGEGKRRRYDVVPDAQSEWGKVANDIFNTCGSFGSSLGLAFYEWTHS